MAERTVLLDATEAVIGAHQELIANGTVAVVSAADFPPGKYPTDIVGRLLEDHRKHCPDICGELEYPRTIPGKRQKANDVSESPAVRDSLLRTSPTSPSGPADPSVRPHGNTTATPQQPGKSPATRILKKIKLSWPDLHYQTVKGALLLSPSPPAIAPSQLRLV